MTRFAGFADALGKPREGIHAARIPLLDIALWDTVGTVVIAGAIAWYFDPRLSNVVLWILMAFAIGFIVHKALGVRTELVRKISG